VHIGGDLNGDVTAEGNLSGNIDLDGTLSASIAVGKDLMSTGDVTLASMADGSQVTIGEDLVGAITVSGSVSGAVDVLDNLALGGSITLGSMLSGSNSRIRVYKSHSGQVAVAGDMNSLIQLNYGAGYTSGSVDIGGDLNGDVTVDGNLNGDISVGHELSGDIEITYGHSLNGDITIKRNMTGTIDVGYDLSGTVHVLRDAEDPNDSQDDFSGQIGVSHDLTGRILIDGSLKDNPAVDYEIEIAGTIDDEGGAITIDYDGWHKFHEWEDGAIVRVDGQNYSDNYPSLHIWEVSECKADLTNDWSVTLLDAHWFWHAQDPDWYSENFPGLEGSRVWHGDTNCDGLYDEDDYVTFMARVASGVCSPLCSLPPPPLRAPPAETAELLLRMLPADQDFDLLEAVGRAANDEDEPEAAQYWWDVLEILLD